jgi:hypothetical protein
MLRRFGEEDAKGFQIIVTEYANLRDDWFQSALVAQPWTQDRQSASVMVDFGEFATGSF